MWARSSFLYAPGDANGTSREPSRDAVTSSYVVEAQESAQSSQMMITALTAGLAIAVLWYMGKKK